MDARFMGAVIKRLRNNAELTQQQLAERIGVSSKTVSKWETAKGLPDITLLQSVATALGVSVAELISGDAVKNKNVAAKVSRCRFYVCPLCGNILYSMGEAHVSCCGITLAPLKASDEDAQHVVTVQKVEDEHFITVCHPMTKEHFISFMAFVTFDRIQLVKLYPEGDAQARFQLGKGRLYIYCNKHGLTLKKI